MIWCLPSLIAPRGVGGTVTGIAILTGYLVGLTGAFGAAFVCASGMRLAGFVAIAILVESFTPVGEPPECMIAMPLSGVMDEGPVKS